MKKAAHILGWELNDLFEKTIQAMRSCEQEVNDAVDAYDQMKGN